MPKSSPQTPIEIIKSWKSNAAIRQAFGTLAAYEAHLKSPESSEAKIINAGGIISVVPNKNRQLSPASALDIVQTWKTDASVRADFKTLNAYRAYREALATGKARVISGADHV